MANNLLNKEDLYLYHQGTNFFSYEMLGAHMMEIDGKKGVRFTVWAPHAKKVAVVGDFNNWDATTHQMERLEDGEIWGLFIEGLPEGSIYKYAIYNGWGEDYFLKADPYAFFAEVKPNTASKVYDIKGFNWTDEKWEENKKASYDKPMIIYEVHLGSWRRNKDGEYLTYREAADELIKYVKDMNYTHIEFMPLCEHPFDGSWGYQATGYYAVTSRFGTPKDFMYLVDTAHKEGIGVIMDWVPGHFCNDAHGLRRFDGETLYESDNEQRRENYQWGTTNFDYGRTEVHSFLISNALFWFKEYHIDGLRIDAVANMLYLNYGREEGQWQPNKYGDTGNLEAIDLIKKLNEAVFKYYPNGLMMAEESTSWPKISHPIYLGGMGFNYKWNMGWMNDILRYMSLDPIYRKWHQDKITFSLMYAFSENYVLPLSHDEVVHGKCSLLEKMPGDYWRKFAGLRAFLGYWMTHPGKKLLFMGGEFGQFIEWKYDDSLDWHLVSDYPMHKKMQDFNRDLNKFYLEHNSLWQVDCDWEGFQWIDCNDMDHSIISFIRYNEKRKYFSIVLCNFTPEVHYDYPIGVPCNGIYREVLNSDSEKYGGSGVLNSGDIISKDIPLHGFNQSIKLTIPPLATIILDLKEKIEVKEAPSVLDKVEENTTPYISPIVAKEVESSTETVAEIPKEKVGASIVEEVLVSKEEPKKIAKAIDSKNKKTKKKASRRKKK